jgi:D-amino-acid dehydrogenase
MTSQTSEKVVIVGAGIVGMSCALFLQRDGYRVTVVDRLDPGRGCSYGNAAGIAFSEVVPISKPGLMTKVPKWLFDPKGPLSIRPSYFPRVLPWLLRFMAAGRASRVPVLAAAAAELSNRARQDFGVVLKAAGAEDMLFCDFCAAIYDHEHEYENARWAWDLRAELGFGYRKISGPQIHELEPDVSADAGCALIMDGWRNITDPYRLVTMMAERFQSDGGDLVKAEVRHIETADRAVRTVCLADGSELSGDHLVIAAGAWSHRLAGPLGSAVPLEADRGYNKTMPNTGIALKRQLVYESAGVAITPLPQGLRIGGAVEFAGVDAAPDYRRSDYLVEKAKRILPGLKDTSGERWMGPRPGLPDFVPVISSSPHFGNLYYAFGHGHLGLTWGPTTGRLIADLVTGRTPDLDMTAYRVDRF